MNVLRRLAGRVAKPSVLWLVGVALACLLAVIGLKLLFDRLQEDLELKRANEQVRLAIGDEILRSIQALEKEIYRMAASDNPAGRTRVGREIDHFITKLRHDIETLKGGGTVQRLVRLNIEGLDEVDNEVSYHADPAAQGYVMELIEVAPMLDVIGAKAAELEGLLLRRDECVERGSGACLIATTEEIAFFLKQIPSHFERLTENANRLFFESSARLRGVEEALQAQKERLKRIELSLVGFVILLAGIISILFMRRIDEANSRLEAAIDEMRAAKEAAERASRAKSEFVSRMSHELRTPLNAIIGFAELLETEPLSPEHKSYVGLINNSGRHLLELINAVLDHAKIEAGSMTLERIAFDLPAAIEAVSSIIRTRAADKGLAFVASIAPDLPRFVIGDPTRLRQVLINLLGNAVKFTEQGSIELRVARDAGRIVFSVRDTGIGMAQAALDRLFRPFSQADDSVTRKYGGTGLGLQIAKELIEAMGGAIEVESAPGVGTVFWFSLPLQAAADASSSAPPIPAALPPLAGLVRGPLLLVDDNRVNQQLGCAMLDRLGLAHECADDGAAALRRLAGAEFAAVLMDMEMPVMDGIAATRAIRAEEARTGKARIPIVAMTANALQEDRERCRAAGMDGFLAKPIVLGALHDELHRLFGGRPAAAPAAPPAERQAAAIFDRAAALERMGDDGLFNEIAALFVADAPGYLAEIDAALAAGDGAALARAAHTFKGLCATFCASAGETTARRLERQAHDGALAGCDELAAQLRTEVEALTAALAGK